MWYVLVMWPTQRTVKVAAEFGSEEEAIRFADRMNRSGLDLGRYFTTRQGTLKQYGLKRPKSLPAWPAMD